MSLVLLDAWALAEFCANKYIFGRASDSGASRLWPELKLQAINWKVKGTQKVTEQLQLAHSQRKYYISFTLLHSSLPQSNGLKQHTHIISDFQWDSCLASFSWVQCLRPQRFNEDVGGNAFSPGGWTEDQSSSKVTRVIGRTHFVVVVGWEPRFS